MPTKQKKGRLAYLPSSASIASTVAEEKKRGSKTSEKSKQRISVLENKVNQQHES